MRDVRTTSIGVGAALLLTVATSGMTLGQTEASTEPVEFTSSYAWSHQPASGERSTTAEGATQVVGEAWQFRGVEASDPRFEGTLTLTDTIVTYPGGMTVSVGTFRIENDGGAWQEMPVYWLDWDAQRQPGKTWQRAFVGEGDYAGLSAIVVDTWRPVGASGAVDIRLDGFVIPGDLPAVPEPWTAP